jgi:RNA-binding protein YhbY
VYLEKKNSIKCKIVNEINEQLKRNHDLVKLEILPKVKEEMVDLLK